MRLILFSIIRLSAWVIVAMAYVSCGGRPKDGTEQMPLVNTGVISNTGENKIESSPLPVESPKSDNLIIAEAEQAADEGAYQQTPADSKEAESPKSDDLIIAEAEQAADEGAVITTTKTNTEGDTKQRPTTQVPRPQKTPQECAATATAFDKYERLMQKARPCRRDSDCTAHLPVNLCSQKCKVAVNRRSKHTKTLKRLAAKYRKDNGCRNHACTTYYSCGRIMWAKCQKGLCQTTAEEPYAECGSPSPRRFRW